MLRPSLSVTKMGWLNPDWFRYGSVSCFPDTWAHAFLVLFSLSKQLTFIIMSSEFEKKRLLSSSTKSFVPTCKGLYEAWGSVQSCLGWYYLLWYHLDEVGDHLFITQLFYFLLTRQVVLKWSNIDPSTFSFINWIDI